MPVDVYANGDLEAAEDSAAVENLEVIRPTLGWLLAPVPGVANLCNPRDLKLCVSVVSLFDQSLGCSFSNR